MSEGPDLSEINYSGIDQTKRFWILIYYTALKKTFNRHEMTRFKKNFQSTRNDSLALKIIVFVFF